MGRELTADNAELRESLLSVMDRKHHWFWEHLNGPGATREQLLAHFQQEWEVYVRDFPLFLRRVRDRCPDPQVRADLEENISEEERGAVSGAGAHAELFLYMMEGLGFGRDRFERVRLFPAAAAYRRWIDEATHAWWLVGAAVTTIFVEGSVNDRSELTNGHAAGGGDEAELSRHPLVVYHGLEPRRLELKRVHRKVEGGHRRDAYRAVLSHALTGSARRAVRTAAERSLDLWRRYRDEVAACGPGLTRRARGRA